MKNFSASLVCLLLTLATLSASAQTIRRVNNTGLTGPNIYTDVATALTASVAGDIIQVEPSGVDYPGFGLNKNVTIVGPGYFLDPATQNAGLQANPLPATISFISVTVGGASATVAGVTISGDVRVAVNNFTIQRCNVVGRIFPESGTNIIGLTIKQCYVTGSVFNPFGVASDNMLVANCVFVNSPSFATNFNGGFFNNVVLTGTTTMSNFFVTNNYFAGTLSGGGNTLSNNLSASTTFPTTNGNQAGITQSQVFVLAPGSTAFDGWYQLKTGTNPAKGTGSGGTDVGIFSLYSTNAPYKLGGLPAIPSIYQQTESITGNSLNGTLSTRSNN